MEVQNNQLCDNFNTIRGIITNAPNTRSIAISTKNIKPNLSNQQRQRIYELLLESITNGQLPRGTYNKIAQQYNVSMRTVKRIWYQGQESLKEGHTCADVKSKASNSGRKRLPLDLMSIDRLPKDQRISLRTISKGTNISLSRLHRALKENLIKKIKDVYIVTNKPKN